MDYLYSIFMVIFLFLLGVISPGPNFIVLVRQSLNNGFKPGMVTGLGIAFGDFIYASLGLFGLTAIIDNVGWLFGLIKLVGGLYLVFLGYKMLLVKSIRINNSNDSKKNSMLQDFRVGLLTDLSNPKTVIFFTSIFATTVEPNTPAWVLTLMLFGIVLTSILWRICLSYIFTRKVLQNRYLRYNKIIETVFGGFLIFFGLKLTFDSVSSRFSIK